MLGLVLGEVGKFRDEFQVGVKVEWFFEDLNPVLFVADERGTGELGIVLRKLEGDKGDEEGSVEGDEERPH